MLPDIYTSILDPLDGFDFGEHKQFIRSTFLSRASPYIKYSVHELYRIFLDAIIEGDLLKELDEIDYAEEKKEALFKYAKVLDKRTFDLLLKYVHFRKTEVDFGEDQEDICLNFMSRDIVEGKLDEGLR